MRHIKVSKPLFWISLLETVHLSHVHNLLFRRRFCFLFQSNRFSPQFLFITFSSGSQAIVITICKIITTVKMLKFRFVYQIRRKKKLRSTLKSQVYEWVSIGICIRLPIINLEYKHDVTNYIIRSCHVVLPRNFVGALFV